MLIAQKNYTEGAKTLSQLYKGEEANRPLASFVKNRQILIYKFNLEFFKPKKDKYHIPESHTNCTEKRKRKTNRISVPS